eukprot:13175420-Heterocapsa_arctica.AAC.1
MVVVHRATGTTAYARMPNKRVQKGAPTPPETVAEVQPELAHLLGDNIVLCADAAPAWARVAKDANLGPVASANRSAKEFVR